MKRITTICAVLMLMSTLAFAAEQSPDRAHVRLADVPRQCLESGTVERNGMKYTCTKVDTSEVWNEIELRKFDKEIFEAYRQPLPREPEPAMRIGLVVRQDTVYTTERIQKVAVADEKNEVAYVERRDGYKYRYSRK